LPNESGRALSELKAKSMRRKDSQPVNSSGKMNDDEERDEQEPIRHYC
jgi:hypothetical protein